MGSVNGDDDGSGYGVLGTSSANNGVIGRSETGDGVLGESAQGHGVHGGSKTDVGVRGSSNTGIGVLGSSDTGVAVMGEASQEAGVVGISKQAAGVLGQSIEANGVMGISKASDTSGVYGDSTDGTGVTGTSHSNFGVFGQSDGRVADKLTAGVAGVNNGAGWGVLGTTDRGRAGVAGLSDSGDGVFGRATDADHAGVKGVHLKGGDGVLGSGNYGVRGTSGSKDGAGVQGENTADLGVGVRGSSPAGVGVLGSTGGVAPFFGRCGVVGEGADMGVFGYAAGRPGVVGFGSPGVLSMNGLDVWGDGKFTGDVVVIKKLSAAVKAFKIDHPLDPENKYLNHASVESSELKTIYDGVAILDEQGRATIRLPQWFEALNGEFRYQLTAIGSAAPEIHVAKEVSDSHFAVAGGKPGQRISWQITGVRHDAYARHAPFEVETEKSAEEIGTYISPAAYQLGEERSVGWSRFKDLLEAAGSAEKRAASAS